MASYEELQDSVIAADEGKTECLELVEQQHEVLEAAAKPVEPPAHDNVTPPPSGVSEESVKGRPTVSRAADTMIHVFPHGPVTSAGVPP